MSGLRLQPRTSRRVNIYPDGDVFCTRLKVDYAGNIPGLVTRPEIVAGYTETMVITVVNQSATVIQLRKGTIVARMYEVQEETPVSGGVATHPSRLWEQVEAKERKAHINVIGVTKRCKTDDQKTYDRQRPFMKEACFECGKEGHTWKNCSESYNRHRPQQQELYKDKGTVKASLVEPPCLTCMGNDADQPKFKLGEAVYVKEGVRTQRGKVVPILSGPYTVVQQISPGNFRLSKESKESYAEREVHINRLRSVEKKGPDAVASSFEVCTVSEDSEARSPTDREEVSSIVEQFFRNEDAVREEAKILRRLSTEIWKDYGATLNLVIQNHSNIIPGKYLEIVAEEMMKEGEPNWGRIAVIATVARKLTFEVGDKEELTTSLANSRS